VFGAGAKVFQALFGQFGVLWAATNKIQNILELELNHYKPVKFAVAAKHSIFKG
jgi:hypothetical protein